MRGDRERDEKPGLPKWPIVDVHATERRRFQAEAQRSTFPDIVGSAEAAEVLQVTRQRLHALRARDDFPRPVAELSGTAVWLRSSIEAFAKSWRRQPGRPQKPRRFLLQHQDMSGQAGLNGGPGRSTSTPSRRRWLAPTWRSTPTTGSYAKRSSSASTRLRPSGSSAAVARPSGPDGHAGTRPTSPRSISMSWFGDSRPPNGQEERTS